MSPTRLSAQRVVQGLPNGLTIMRLLVSPVLLAAILSKDYPFALLLAALAGISDGLDGMIAKRFDCRSRFGDVMDPLADKAMLWCAFIGLGWVSLIPAWLPLLIVLRDVTILSGAGAFRALVGNLPIAPNISSKINTCCQIALALWLLLSMSLAFHAHSVTVALVAIVAVTTVVSGMEYVFGWSRIYAAHVAHSPSSVRAARQARRGRSAGSAATPLATTRR